MGKGSLEVVRAGPLTTVQDLGRPGWAHLGVPRSGAVDGPALRAANRLVGNPESAAGLETTMLGCRLRASGTLTVAVTGARAELRVAGRPAPFGAAFPVPDGEVLDIGPARRGVRSYLAVTGGVAVPPVLGSRATDTLSGLGPAPLRDNDRLPVGEADPSPAIGLTRAESGSVACAAADDGPVRIRLGPRRDWFTDAAVHRLLGTGYRVTPLSNRVGVRLAGATLERAVPGELPSEGMLLGAVQVPADGQPLIFLADHPVTGGYPVIAVVDEADLPKVAQARPGDLIRFREWT